MNSPKLSTSGTAHASFASQQMFRLGFGYMTIGFTSSCILVHLLLRVLSHFSYFHAHLKKKKMLNVEKQKNIDWLNGCCHWLDQLVKKLNECKIIIFIVKGQNWIIMIISGTSTGCSNRKQHITSGFLTPSLSRGVLELDRTLPSSSTRTFLRGGCSMPASNDWSQWLPSSSLLISTPNSPCSLRSFARFRSDWNISKITWVICQSYKLKRIWFESSVAELNNHGWSISLALVIVIVSSQQSEE